MTKPPTGVHIPGIPETIPRGDYLHLISSVGFTLDDLVSLNFNAEGITAEVLAHDEHGNHIIRADNPASAHTHHVFIKVTDDNQEQTA